MLAEKIFASKDILSPLQVKILISIRGKGLINVGAVSKLTGIGQANVSTICKKMEKEGFVIRQRDKKDERVVFISITGEGERIVDDLFSKNGEIDKFLSGVEPERLNIIVNGVNELEKLTMEMMDYFDIRR